MYTWIGKCLSAIAGAYPDKLLETVTECKSVTLKQLTEEIHKACEEEVADGNIGYIIEISLPLLSW